MEGTRGGGKTDNQLMFYRRFVGLGYGAFWRGVIFDREYKNLDDLIVKSKRWFSQFNDGAKFLKGGGDYKWVWPTGEELLFRQMKTEDDYWKYHGQEFPFIGWNELTKQPNSNLYDMMMSCNRSSFLPAEHTPKDCLTFDNEGNIIDGVLPELPLVVFSTTNPYGVGHNWVKQRFIDPAPCGKVVRITKEVFNPRTQKKEEISKTQVRIFSSYKENRFLSPEYVLELENITDPNKRKAWLEGDWDITSGGMFDDVWSSQYNVVEPFSIPNTWRVFRSFDWGSSKPFSVGWWAESDGSDYVDHNGNVRSSVRGDLFRIGEWYGWNGVPNKGLTMLATQVAKGIVVREAKMGIATRVKAGPADNSIWDDVNGNCIARDMGKKVRIDGKLYQGVSWERSNKSAGSRKNGWELMRIAISNAQPNEHGYPREEPGMFVFRNCDQFIRTVPTIPRDTKDLDDVDTDAEDHIADETRYVILSVGNRFSTGRTTGHH
ncbi:MAG: putative terminase large subunit [Prokaryotic dsDNA virus sp.]|nr:MAG: putative terminase large subunit [Prokaryotic dsDNA virus sp.]|tara:strand:- start:54151 stop:55617 length:1467 start_codon:yes stop_codon:yes gene_type:complete